MTVEYQIFKAKNTNYAFFPSNLQLSRVNTKQLNRVISQPENLRLDPPKLKTVCGDIINNLILNISGACNLRCKYCIIFGNTRQGSLLHMTFETAKTAIDTFIAENPASNGFGIVFFGGEPLLNEKVIEKVLDYCREISLVTEKQVSFSLVTNGTILTKPIIEMIRKFSVKLSITIDGDERNHNLNRDFNNGKPTYAKINRNILWLQDEGIPFELCAGITYETRDYVKFFKTLESFRVPFSFGFIQKNIFEKETGYNSQHLGLIENEFVRLIKYYIKRIESNRSVNCTNMYDALSAIHNRAAKAVRCTAGKNVITVNPDGTIYSCQFISNIPSASIGTLSEGIDCQKRSEFSAIPLQQSPECSSCSIRLFCGGSCFADNYIVNNALDIPVNYSCRLMHIEWEGYINLYLHTYQSFF
ncbi:MAG: radical SAM protein [Alphaproteobacteria bacterium]|nr:radical SAM protein [Alphaproteobacteria bacterium]